MTEPTLTFTLLGTPSLHLDGTPATGLPSAKVAALAYFLAAAGRAQSRETLASLLWPDYDTSQAKKNLRGALYHLRNAVGEHLLVTRQAAEFDPTRPIAVDAAAFAAAVQRAHAGGQNIDFAALEAAAQLYTGDFLDGFHLADAEPFDEWLLAERARYKRLAIQTLHTLVTAALADGRRLQGIDYASRLLVLDPFHEETHRHLMLLLALDGQPQAALAQFEQCRALLWTELGVDPDDETNALAERIERGEIADATVSVATSTTPRRLVNLPAERTRFFDREEFQAQALDWLADPACRLITLTGVGGVGKSRLALQLGRRAAQEHSQDPAGDNGLPRDICFVPLAGIEPDIEPDTQVQTHIVAAIADALGIRFTGDERPLIQLTTALSARRVLLILDNFEQIQADGAPVLSDLLDRCPQLQCLVTSRTRVAIQGERLLALPGLDAPDDPDAEAGWELRDLDDFPAAQLFLERAATVTPGFAPDASGVRAIAATCRLLEGLPLGIELAANWTRLLTPQEIAHELQQSLDFLGGSIPDLPPRQRSLRAVFDYTWAMLDTDEQQTLARLSVFRGGFTTRAAQAVTGANLAQLASLADQSLIRRVDAEDDTDTGLRHELSEVLRQYAAEKLAQRADAAATHAAHARYYADRLEALAADIRGGDQPDALDRVAHEIENLRATYRWIGEELGRAPAVATATIARSMTGLFDFYDIRGWYAEGRAVFAAATAAIESMGSDALDRDADDRDAVAGKTALLAALRARLGWLTFLDGDALGAERVLTSALALAEDNQAAEDAQRDIAFILNYLGALRRHTGDLDGAHALLTRGLAVAEAASDQYTASLVLNTLGQVASLQGDSAAAAAYCSRALRIKRRLGDRRGQIYSLTYLGRVAEMEGRVDEARSLYAESLKIADELGDPRGIAISQHNLANAALTQGQYAGARRLFQRTLDLYRAMGSRSDMSVALSRLGEVALAQHDLPTAARTLDEALDLADAAQAEPARITALLAVAALLTQMGDTARARTILGAVAATRNLTERQRLRVAQLQPRLDLPPEPTADLGRATDVAFDGLQLVSRAGTSAATP